MYKLIELLIKIFSRPLTTKPTEIDDFGTRVIRSMKRKGYKVDTHNIVYVIGYYGNEPNLFNDLRSIVYTNGAEPRRWICTTDPGARYVYQRINPKGAAQIKPGQYTSWRVGMHRGHHEALVQTGGLVTVLRDDNEDFRREGDKPDTGYFGINQHGPGSETREVGSNSAGCLVARSMPEHREFMALVKQFPGYQAHHGYVFTTTILEAKDVI